VTQTLHRTTSSILLLHHALCRPVQRRRLLLKPCGDALPDRANSPVQEEPNLQQLGADALQKQKGNKVAKVHNGYDGHKVAKVHNGYDGAGAARFEPTKPTQVSVGLFLHHSAWHHEPQCGQQHLSVAEVSS